MGSNGGARAHLGDPGSRRFFYELSPRARVALSQLPLTAATVLVALMVIAWHPGLASDPLFRSGMLAHAAMFIVACVVPWERLPPGAVLAVPLLDFVPIGMVRLAGIETIIQLGVLTVIPVVWLAWSGLHPRFCLAMSFLGPLLMVWLPLALAGTVDPAQYADVTVLPVMMLATAAVVRMLSSSAAAQQHALARARDGLQEALDALGREKRLLDAVLDTVGVGVQAVDATGRTVLANRAQLLNKALAGRTPGAKGNSWPRIYGRNGAPMDPEVQPVARACRGEAFADTVVRLGQGPGQRIFSTSGTPLHGPDGIEGAVVAFTDVTTLVNALAVRDEFLNNVSHELRTPLTSVLGYVEMLQEAQGIPAHARRGLEVVQRNAERLQRLVDDLLSAAAGTPDHRPRPVDAAELVRLAVATAAPLAEAGQLRLLDRTPGPVPAVLDPVRIAQALDNLLSNAVKYTPPGGEVAITASRDGDSVVIEVADTGIGMDPSETQSLFSKFYRTETARRTAIPGVGLGLSITKAIVEAHHGTITCTSTTGRGTVFVVHLPDPAPGSGYRHTPRPAQEPTAHDAR
ncbi:sensor histidine kinase [Sinomonas atrocyanea]|uniref:sensor histidine kinase n=1 Tax=Sinomonas atrocyanea TaxID=37927 RepID=UPI003D98DBEA